MEVSNAVVVVRQTFVTADEQVDMHMDPNKMGPADQKQRVARRLHCRRRRG